MSHMYAPRALRSVIFCQNPTAKYQGRKKSVPVKILVISSTITVLRTKTDQWYIRDNSSRAWKTERSSMKRGWIWFIKAADLRVRTELK